MSAVYITKGDMYLAVGPSGDCILIESGLVKAASTVLATKIAEAQDRASDIIDDQKPVVALPSDEPEVIMSLMRIINMQLTGQSLRNFLGGLAINQLYELLVAAKKYDCVDVLDTEGQEPTASPSSTSLVDNVNCMLQFACVSHQLGYVNTYEAAVRQLTLSFLMSTLRGAWRKIDSSLLPKHFLRDIGKDQTRLVKEMLVMLDKVMSTLEGGFPCISSDIWVFHYCNDDEEKEECALKHHEIYSDRLAKVSLWPIPDNARDVPFTVKELYSHARSALRNDVEQPCASFGEPDDDWTTYEWQNRIYYMPWSTRYDFFYEGTEDFLPVRKGEIPEGFTEEL